MSKYTVRISFEMLTDGKVDGDVVLQEHSDELAVHVVKVQTFTKALCAMLPEVQDQLIAMVNAEIAKVLAEQGGKGK